MSTSPRIESTSPLARQALGRPLTPAEKEFAGALETIFGGGTHDMAAVAQQLEERHVSRPSGERGAWSLTVLQDELSAINRSLDDAYAEAGTPDMNHCGATCHG
jgi:hypothetical protein